MSESSNVWDAGDAASGATETSKQSTAAALGPDSNELPPVADLFMETIEDFKLNWKAHGLTGLGMMIPVMIMGVFLGFAYVGMLLAIINQMDALLLISSIALLIGALTVAVAMGPLTFAMFSVQNSHLEGDTDALGMGGYFSRLFENPLGAVGYQFASAGLGFCGLLFFIVGAFVVQIALSMTIPAMTVHRMGVIAAITRSASHMKAHFVWHLGFWGLGFVVMAIAGNIPFVGYAFGMPFFACYMLRGYRAVFGGVDSEYAGY